jgi:hypothetical protein
MFLLGFFSETKYLGVDCSSLGTQLLTAMYANDESEKNMNEEDGLPRDPKKWDFEKHASMFLRNLLSRVQNKGIQLESAMAQIRDSFPSIAKSASDERPPKAGRLHSLGDDDFDHSPEISAMGFGKSGSGQIGPAFNKSLVQPISSRSQPGICYVKAKSKTNECTRQDCPFRHDFSHEERVTFLISELAKGQRPSATVHALGEETVNTDNNPPTGAEDDA